jgi:hypothetical protein
MGAWSHLVDTVPELPEDPSRQDKFRARLSELASFDVNALTVLLNEQEEEKEILAKQTKAVDFEIETLERALRYRLKEQNLDSVIANGYRWTPSPEPYPSVKDKVPFTNWVIEHMRDNVQLHHGTLKSVVKNALQGEGEMPPGVDIFLKYRFARTKQK